MKSYLSVLVVTVLMLTGCSSNGSTQTTSTKPKTSNVDLCREVQGVIGQYTDLLTASQFESPNLAQLAPIISRLEDLIPLAENSEQGQFIANLIDDFKLMGNPETIMQGLSKFTADALNIGVVCKAKF